MLISRSSSRLINSFIRSKSCLKSVKVLKHSGVCQSNVISPSSAYHHGHGHTSINPRSVLSQSHQYSEYGLRSSSTMVAEASATEVSLDSLLAVLRSIIAKDHTLSIQDIESVLSEIPKHQKLPEGICSSLLQCCADFLPSKEKIKIALKVWNTCGEKGYEFSIEDLHKMLEVYIAARHPLEGELPWSSLDSTIISNTGSLLRLLQCTAETGDLGRIATILNEIRQRGCFIGDEVFACLIRAHGRAKNYNEVHSVLNTMRDAAVSPGSNTYIALLQAQIENGQPIKGTLTQMKEERLYPNDKQITKVIYSIAISKRDDLLPLVTKLISTEDLSLELKNCVIDLIYENYEDIAIKLVSKCSRAFGAMEQPNTFAAFMAKAFAVSNKKPEDIIRLCDQLQNIFPSHQSFLLSSTEASLRDQTKTEMSSSLLEHVKPLRNHYFWPLIVRTKNLQQMAVIINQMQKLGLKIDFDTLSFYIFPNLLHEEVPISIVQYLQKNCHLSISTVLGPLVQSLLFAKLLDEAVVLCKQYKTRVLNLTRLPKPLMSATLSTKNFPATATLLSLLSKSKHVTQKPIDIVGLFLVEYSNKCGTGQFEQMLQLIQLEKLRISMASYEQLTTSLNLKQSSALMLASITNSSQDGSTNFNTLPHPREMGIDELEGHLVELRSKNLNIRGTLRRLLQLHSRLNNLKRAMEIKQEMDAKCYTLSPGILASLLNIHLLNEDCVNASETLKQLTSQHPSFRLDEHKIIDLCVLKIKNGADEAEVFTTLKEYATLMKKHCHNIRGGPDTLRNCEALITAAKEKFGKTTADTLRESLKYLRFLQ